MRLGADALRGMFPGGIFPDLAALPPNGYDRQGWTGQRTVWGQYSANRVGTNGRQAQKCIT
jgi:hypothetical protein